MALLVVIGKIFVGLVVGRDKIGETEVVSVLVYSRDQIEAVPVAREQRLVESPVLQTSMMEKLVAELREIVPFKETTEEGDLVLIAAKKPRILLYALVTAIERDRSRRDEWYHVSMSLLSVPPQSIVWTLRIPQFTGQEIFTMGGEERFVQAVRLPQPPPPEKQERERGPSDAKRNRLRVIK